MSKRSVVDWLSDSVLWGEHLEGHIKGMTYDSFATDLRTQDAASKCVEAIGLAANELIKLDPSLEQNFPALQLSLAYKARNKLSHGYYAIDPRIVWITVTESIPKTVTAARAAKKTLGGLDSAGDRI